ncbi:NPCBM/NEW2 domain-containing protein [Lentisphaerota bacterium WC36G]|nr:NPCBM/NEW2 domain-containing protein [Lentisphaerae bacterium WC36]
MKKSNYLRVKKFLSLSFVASMMLSVSSSLNASTNTVDGNFSVLTYNIGALPWPAYNYGTAGNPDGRVQEIGPRLNSFDIVGVQEQFSLFDEFREDTRFPYFSINKHLYSGGSGLDTLSKYPMAKSKKIEFDENPFYVAKGFQKNTVTIYPGVYVDVYNTHTGDDYNDHIVHQLQQISDYIQANSPADRAVIFIGDMNVTWHWPGTALQPLITANNFQDACVVATGNQHGPVDRILYRSGADVTLTLDHYERMELNQHTGDKYFGHFTKDGKLLSDHPAVLAEFNFTVADNKRLQSGDTRYLSEMKINHGYNNGFDHGPFGINQGIGGGDEWDGQAMRMDPKSYSKGIGVHAFSRIIVNTDKKYSRFISDVGIDEESGPKGKVRFKVFINATETAWGTLVFDSGIMEPWTPTKTVDIDVSNADTLKLVVTTEGSDSWDHADWANARFILK